MATDAADKNAPDPDQQPAAPASATESPTPAATKPAAPKPFALDYTAVRPIAVNGRQLEPGDILMRVTFRCGEDAAFVIARHGWTAFRYCEPATKDAKPVVYHNGQQLADAHPERFLDPETPVQRRQAQQAAAKASGEAVLRQKRLAALQSFKGIGPEIAAAFLDHQVIGRNALRQALVDRKRVTELEAIPGVGITLLEDLAQQIGVTRALTIDEERIKAQQEKARRERERSDPPPPAE